MAGRAYTHTEKLKILQYIVKNYAYSEVKGNKLWKEMSEHIPDRSWQSLKEHFKKRLIYDLHFSHFKLTEGQIKLFRQCFFGKMNRRDIESSRAIGDDGGNSPRNSDDTSEDGFCMQDSGSASSSRSIGCGIDSSRDVEIIKVEDSSDENNSSDESVNFESLT